MKIVNFFAKKFSAIIFLPFEEKKYVCFLSLNYPAQNNLFIFF